MLQPSTKKDSSCFHSRPSRFPSSQPDSQVSKNKKTIWKYAQEKVAWKLKLQRHHTLSNRNTQLSAYFNMNNNYVDKTQKRTGRDSLRHAPFTIQKKAETTANILDTSSDRSPRFQTGINWLFDFSSLAIRLLFSQ